MKPFSLFQSDMNLTSSCQSDFIDNFAEQVTATGTNAILYLTLYPIMGFGAVTDAGVQEFAQKMLQITNTGRKVIIRYARYC